MSSRDDTVPQEAAPSEPAPREVSPRRRRRIWPWIVVPLMIVVLVVAAFVVAERVAQDRAHETVRDRVGELLDLPPGAEVEVDLGDGLLIPQLLSGGIAVMDVVVPEATFGGFAGSVVVHAEQLPLAADEAVGRLDIQVILDASQVIEEAEVISGMTIDETTLADGELVISATGQVQGIDIPISLAIEPDVEQGAIVFTHTRADLAGIELNIAELVENPGLNRMIRSLLPQEPVCVAEQLPEAFGLESAEFVDDTLVIGIDGDGFRRADAQGRGTCG